MAVTDAYHVGLRYLTRREHGEIELARKLRAKGFEDQEIQSALELLISEGYLNNTRFAQNYTRSRLNSGWGPVIIVQELLSKGLPDFIIESTMEDFKREWDAVATGVRTKKFGSKMPSNFQEKAKQMRFLQYRGFSQAHIKHVFEMVLI
jgi:regulatory protein